MSWSYRKNLIGKVRIYYSSGCVGPVQIPLDELADELNDYEARIAELEAGQRWIPVSERLPKDKKHYMTVVMNCYDGSRDIYRLRYYGNGDWFSWASESNVVTHWKEEPALPEVQE